MSEDFVTTAKTKLNEYLLKTESLFTENRKRWVSDFVGHFRGVCEIIQKLQGEMASSAAISSAAIAYVEYIMLNTSFVKRRYCADIFIFNEKSYLDKTQSFVGHYDISFLFIYFDKLWDDLIVLRKSYPKQVSVRDVTSFMLKALPSFYSYLPCISRIAIQSCSGKTPRIIGAEGSKGTLFSGIKKTDVFMVNVGDYMAKTETVYEERKDKNAKKLSDWFGEQLYGRYVFGDYSGLDFSGLIIRESDFRYARFSDSVLKDVDMEGSTLIGANFCGSNLLGCRFDNCSLYEADFSDSLLINASFKNTRAKAGLTCKTVWKSPGFLPVSFCRSDLSKADFSRANLIGADFTGATLRDDSFMSSILDEANFTGTILNNVNFTGAILDGVNFTRAILNNINFTDAILNNANFTDAVLDKTDFTGAILNKTNFTGAILNNADFTNAATDKTIIMPESKKIRALGYYTCAGGGD